MPLFRKKPLVVEAEQYIEHVKVQDGPVFVSETPGVCFDCHDGAHVDLEHAQAHESPHVHTIQGERVHVSSGEWIVKEREGDGYYPIADETFRATYEPVEP